MGQRMVKPYFLASSPQPVRSAISSLLPPAPWNTNTSGLGLAGSTVSGW